MEVAKTTLEDVLRQMRDDGNAFGARIRKEQGKPERPEPVTEVDGTGSPRYRVSGTEGFRIRRLRELGLVSPEGYVWTWSQFFDRKQEEINPRTR